MRSHLQTIRPYLDFVKTLFGHLADESNRHGVPPDVLAKDYLSDRGRQQEFSKHIGQITGQINKFWQVNGPWLRGHLRQMPGLKAGLAGDMGPQPSDHVFERAGLYFDTIIVYDPLVHAATLPSEFLLNQDYYLIKYGIIQCQLRDLYLAETTPPIAYLLGDPGMLAGPSVTGPEPFELAWLDTVMLVNELYDTDFDSFSEVTQYFERFASNEEAVRNLARPEMFVFNPYVDKNPEAQWSFAQEQLAKDIWPNSRMVQGSRASLVSLVISGRMGQAVDILQRTVQQGFHPLVAAPASYHWLIQKIRLNQRHVSKELGIDFSTLATTNALLKQKNAWLGNVTLEQLVKLRQRNELGDLRAELNRNFDVLAGASLDTLDSRVIQVD